ncbi:MAG: PDZ domain-containing protein, partial [Patescibacteria group bacterium]
KHEMIGLNTVIIPGAMMSFSLFIEYAEIILPRLMREKLVEHGAAGFSFADTTQMLPTFFIKHSLTYPPEEHGVMVTEMNSITDAARSHVRVGDIVIRFNNISIRNAQELEKRLFLDHRPGEEVVLTMKRGTQVFERKIRLIAYTSPFIKKDN